MYFLTAFALYVAYNFIITRILVLLPKLILLEIVTVPVVFFYSFTVSYKNIKEFCMLYQKIKQLKKL